MIKVIQTKIWIDENHQWWNQDQKIDNQRVLRLFKENLHFDDNYFIYLKSLNLEEKGYLKEVRGFPLLTLDVKFNDHNLEFFLDNQKIVNIDHLFYDQDKNYFWQNWLDNQYNSNIPFLLTSNIIQALSPYIIEREYNGSTEYSISIKEDYFIPIYFKNVVFINQYVL